MDPGPAAVLATATRAAVHASLRGPVPPASVVEGQIVVLEVVTEVRVTLLEEFIIDHGMPVPVHPHATSAAAVSASFPSSTDTLVAVASQSNAAGDSNVLIYLGGQGQPSPTQSLLLSKEQTEVGVPSAVVAEIVVPLCAIFFCFGLLIAWRVVRKAQERKDRGGQNGVDWDGRDEENRGGPRDSSCSRLLRSLWRNLPRPKETQSRSDTPSIASSSSISTSSSLPPHDPDPDPLLEPGLAYPPALDFDTPSDPFAHARSRSAGQVNDSSQLQYSDVISCRNRHWGKKFTQLAENKSISSRSLLFYLHTWPSLNGGISIKPTLSTSRKPAWPQLQRIRHSVIA
ncbi:hypothetical protein HDU78_004779 [Chytriomyces hyalinus]|nr:hypothetical protein HDU78_004779 [Chytriomyces hyalinus]